MAVDLANALYLVIGLIVVPEYLRRQTAGQLQDESVLATAIVVTDTILVILLALSLLFALGSYKRWTWAFFGQLAYLAVGLLSFPSQLIDQLSGGPVPAIFLFGDAVEFASAALLVWMLIALIKYGIWASPKRPSRRG